MADYFEFENRFVVSIREPMKDLEMPNRGLVFRKGGIASLYWQHDAGFKPYYLTFMKNSFSKEEVLSFIQTFRLQMFKLESLRVGNKPIVSYASLSKKHIIALVVDDLGLKKELKGAAPYEMHVIEPEKDDYESYKQWDEYRRPIVKGLFNHIYRQIKAAHRDFPRVTLADPPEEISLEKKVDELLGCVVKKIPEKRGASYIIDYKDARIEGIIMPELIWDMLWAGMINVFQYEEGKIIPGSSIVKNKPYDSNDIKKEIASRGFKYMELYEMFKRISTKYISQSAVYSLRK
ncbi:MAG: hypothetical protein ABII64_00495 [Elusimicrobiota bacterium]